MLDGSRTWRGNPPCRGSGHEAPGLLHAFIGLTSTSISENPCSPGCSIRGAVFRNGVQCLTVFLRMGFTYSERYVVSIAEGAVEPVLTAFLLHTKTSIRFRPGVPAAVVITSVTVHCRW